MTEPLPQSIREKYLIESEPSPSKPHWIIACPTCGARWQLNEPAPRFTFHLGSILKLLDHAASHQPKEKDND